MTNQIHSEQINEIAKALAQAQSEIQFASKDGTNPHFKSSFATLSSHLEVCKQVLGKHGLMVTQLSSTEDGKNVLVTILAHTSGQWFKSVYPLIPVKNDPQGMGSCISYARRYMLSAIVGTASADDDGNEACAEDKQKVRDEFVKKKPESNMKIPSENVQPQVKVPSENVGEQGQNSPALPNKITDDQCRIILESLVQTNDEFKKIFYAKLLKDYNIHNLPDMEAMRFDSALNYIKLNIKRIQDEKVR